VDTESEDELFTDASGVSIDGVLMGETPTRSGNRIRLDQGLDTTEISPARALDPLLLETQYSIEIDNRLGMVSRLLSPSSMTTQSPPTTSQGAPTTSS
jgi:hypothetical protein